MKPLTNLDTQNTKATVWISGVTASGKTTLGASLYQSLLNLGIKNLVHLDGDELRAKQSKVYGHSLEERMELIQKYIELVQEENNKGNVVIISTVSHKKEMRDSARKQLANFMEVNLLCDSQICSNRDYKNIYNRIDKHSDECLPGVTEPYILSKDAELILDTGRNSLTSCHDQLFESVTKYLSGIIR
jgi:adenylylsulfate kinase